MYRIVLMLLLCLLSTSPGFWIFYDRIQRISVQVARDSHYQIHVVNNTLCKYRFPQCIGYLRISEWLFHMQITWQWLQTGKSDIIITAVNESEILKRRTLRAWSWVFCESGRQVCKYYLAGICQSCLHSLYVSMLLHSLQIGHSKFGWDSRCEIIKTKARTNGRTRTWAGLAMVTGS